MTVDKLVAVFSEVMLREPETAQTRRPPVETMGRADRWKLMKKRSTFLSHFMRDEGVLWGAG